MWTVQRILLRRLFNHAYNLGVADTLAKKTFENLDDKADKWIAQNLENKHE